MKLTKLKNGSYLDLSTISAIECVFNPEYPGIRIKIGTGERLAEICVPCPDPQDYADELVRFAMEQQP